MGCNTNYLFFREKCCQGCSNAPLRSRGEWWDLRFLEETPTTLQSLKWWHLIHLIGYYVVGKTRKELGSRVALDTRNSRRCCDHLRTCPTVVSQHTTGTTLLLDLLVRRGRWRGRVTYRRVVLRDSASATIVPQTTAVPTSLHRLHRRHLHHSHRDHGWARRGTRKFHHCRHTLTQLPLSV